MKHFTLQTKYKTIGVILFWLLVWQVISLGLPRLLFAGPLEVLTSLWKLIWKAEFWISTAFSFFKVCFGFLLAFISANLIAVAAFRIKLLNTILMPLLQMMKALPVASFIIVALIWISSKNISVLISFVVAFPITYVNTLEGLYKLDRGLWEMAVVFRIPFGTRVSKIYLPQLFPFIAGGLKVSAGMCWKAGIAGEIIGLPKNSIGEKLYLSKLYLNTADLFAWTAVIILLSAVFEKAFIFFLKKAESYLLKTPTNKV